MLHPSSHRFLRTDINKNKQLHHFFSTYSRSTLCLPYFPSMYPTLYCSELPSSIATKLQIWSDRTARHPILSFDFHLPDFITSTGVGTSTSCFCLNYHIFLLTTYFQATGNNNNSSKDTVFYYTLVVVVICFFLLETSLQLLRAHFICCAYFSELFFDNCFPYLFNSKEPFYPGQSFLLFRILFCVIFEVAVKSFFCILLHRRSQ